MAKLCIKKFKNRSEKPLKTVSIPLAVLKIVKNFKGKKILLTGCYEPLAIYMLKKLRINS